MASDSADWINFGFMLAFIVINLLWFIVMFFMDVLWFRKDYKIVKDFEKIINQNIKYDKTLNELADGNYKTTKDPSKKEGRSENGIEQVVEYHNEGFNEKTKEKHWEKLKKLLNI